MTLPIRRSLALSVLVAATVGLAACSGGAGTTATSTTSDTPTTGATSPLASIDPCGLLTQDQMTQLGLDPGKPDNTAKSRGCEWNKGPTYTIGIYLNGSQPIQTAGTDGATKVSLESHDAVQSTSSGFGCGVQIAISNAASVDVNLSTDDCQVALTYAQLIEPKLPAQQK